MSERDVRSLVGRSVILSGSDSSDKYAFVVDAATPTTSVLHPDDAAARRFATTLDVGAAVTLCAPVSDGILLTEALVEQWAPASRVLALSNPAQLRHLERRSVFRVPVRFGVRIGVERDEGMVFGQGETLDVSAAGLAAIVRGLVVEAGEQAAIALELRGGGLLAVGRVVEAGETGRPIRMHIEQIASGDFSRLAAELRLAEVRRVRVAAASRG